MSALAQSHPCNVLHSSNNLQHSISALNNFGFLNNFLISFYFHRTIFAQYFNEIYSMPEAVVLTNVNTVLKDHSTAPRR